MVVYIAYIETETSSENADTFDVSPMLWVVLLIELIVCLLGFQALP